MYWLINFLVAWFYWIMFLPWFFDWPWYAKALSFLLATFSSRCLMEAAFVVGFEEGYLKKRRP